jgi:hypothetical protein
VRVKRGLSTIVAYISPQFFVNYFALGIMLNLLMLLLLPRKNGYTLNKTATLKGYWFYSVLYCAIGWLAVLENLCNELQVTHLQ